VSGRPIGDGLPLEMGPGRGGSGVVVGDRFVRIDLALSLC